MLALKLNIMWRADIEAIGKVRSIFVCRLLVISVDDGQTCIIDGWNCAFGADLDKLRPMAAANTDSVSDLLFGFFRFYANLDHGNHVLCTRTGRVVDITAFTSRMKKDERLGRFKV